jgi:hypothetical protein
MAYAPHEREFMGKVAAPDTRHRNFGNNTNFLRPAGAQRFSSQISLCSEDPYDVSELFDLLQDGPVAPVQSGQPREKGQRMKNVAKKLYPAKMVGGARVLGSAFRHPMVTTRKMNAFMKRKSNKTGDKPIRRGSLPLERHQSVIDNFPQPIQIVNRSMTVRDRHRPEMSVGLGMSSALLD